MVQPATREALMNKEDGREKTGQRQTGREEATDILGRQKGSQTDRQKGRRSPQVGMQEQETVKARKQKEKQAVMHAGVANRQTNKRASTRKGKVA